MPHACVRLCAWLAPAPVCATHTSTAPCVRGSHPRRQRGSSLVLDSVTLMLPAQEYSWLRRTAEEQARPNFFLQPFDNQGALELRGVRGAGRAKGARGWLGAVALHLCFAVTT